MRVLKTIFLIFLSLGILTGFALVGAGMYAISYFSRDLPDYNHLKDFQPPEVSRVYAGDGRLMAEFAQERRVFVPIDSIPPLVKNAFIAAEDQNFYRHKGVDFTAVLRAALLDLRNRGRGKRPEGASTITQQVAKNFLLTNEVSFKRKIREAILAFRIERALPKDRILELYLNQIYLGQGSYGVAAAALNYFNKPLDDLAPQEAAYLAVLPKAPNNYDPVRHADAALARRNWVLDRMADNKFINRGEADTAKAMPLNATGHTETSNVTAPYFAEEVRRELAEKYGDAALYGGGLVVRTSVNPKFQAIAEKALRAGLMAYDQRHGWRGPLMHVERTSNWQQELATVKAPVSMLDSWRLAIVTRTEPGAAALGFANGSEVKLNYKDSAWAHHGDGSALLRDGDVVMVELITPPSPPPLAPKADDKTPPKPVAALPPVWVLRQIPKVNGAMVVLDPNTGRVLAMQGGWSYKESEFNRATQAWRQPGSSFKPYVYLTALEKGFTPATLVLDAPISLSPGAGQKMWTPQNYNHEQFGPVTLRFGLEKSLNLVTIRVANWIGMPSIVDTAVKFGVVDKMAPMISNAIGAQVTTVMRQVTAYAQFDNGGKKLVPTMIDRIEDRNGKTIFSHDTRACVACGPLIPWDAKNPVPQIPDKREQLADPRLIYQIVSMMQGVVQRGTGKELSKLGRPLAGKTGTTNDSKDTWFVGYSPDLVAGVYIGYDNPKTLGRHETGATVALPVFYQFMQDALADTPPAPFRVPPGLRQVLINEHNGGLAQPGDAETIWESFVEGTEPSENQSFGLNADGIGPLPPDALPKYDANAMDDSIDKVMGDSNGAADTDDDQSDTGPAASSPDKENNDVNDDANLPSGDSGAVETYPVEHPDIEHHDNGAATTTGTGGLY